MVSPSSHGWICKWELKKVHTGQGCERGNRFEVTQARKHWSCVILIRSLDEFLLELPEEKNSGRQRIWKHSGLGDRYYGSLVKIVGTTENTNSAKTGEAPAAHMNTVLELPGKTVVLVGHCNNTILVGVEEEGIVPSKTQ